MLLDLFVSNPSPNCIAYSRSLPEMTISQHPKFFGGMVSSNGSVDINSASSMSNTNSMIIDEDKMVQTFQDIVNCINMDDDDNDNILLLNSGTFPYLVNEHWPNWNFPF